MSKHRALVSQPLVYYLMWSLVNVGIIGCGKLVILGIIESGMFSFFSPFILFIVVTLLYYLMWSLVNVGIIGCGKLVILGIIQSGTLPSEYTNGVNFNQSKFSFA